MQGTLLFDPDARAVRASDPATSRQAPGPLGRNRGCAEVLLIIAAAGDHGATCADVLHELTDADRGNTSRRITDLLHAGLVARHDGTPPRARGKHGRPQQVNHITAAGLAAIAHARRILSEPSADIATPTPSPGGGVGRGLGSGHAPDPHPVPGASTHPLASATPEAPENETDPGGHTGAGPHQPSGDLLGSDRPS